MIQILLIAIISLLAQLVAPWWSLALVAFAVCCWRSPGVGPGASRRAFLYGFVGVALVWLAYALLIHVRTDGIFTNRMSQLLFKAEGSVLLLLATAILGGLVGGLAGLAGYFTRRSMVNRPAVGNA